MVGFAQWRLCFMVAVLLMCAGAVRGQTTPTLFSVKIMSEVGDPVAGAQAMIFVADPGFMRSGGKWKAAQDGVVTFTQDDLPARPKALDPKIPGYVIVAQAPNYSLGVAEMSALPADPDGREVSIELKSGRKAVVEIVPPADTELPPDLEPWIIPEKYVATVWTGLHSEEFPSEPVVLPVTREGKGRFSFKVDGSTPPLYVMVNHPGFLRAWQFADPVETTGTLENPAQVALPKPVSVQVNFNNKFADKMAPNVRPELNVSVRHSIPESKGIWIVTAGRFENEPGDRTWEITDLAPGEYSFHATEGRVESYDQKTYNYGSGDSGKVALTSIDAIPDVIAVDANGATIADAEAYLTEKNIGRMKTRGWQAAKDGVISLSQSDLTGGHNLDAYGKKFTAVVRAPGYAATTAELTVGPPDAEPVRVTLDPGKKITLKIIDEAGRGLPDDLKPLVLGAEHFPEMLSSLYSPDYTLSLAVAESVGDGIFEFHIPSDTDLFRVVLKHDDLVALFTSEAYTDFSKLPLELKIPRTGSLEADVKLTSATSGNYHLDLRQTVSSQEVFIFSETINKSTTTLVSNLAPGAYSFYGGVVRWNRANATPVEIKPGETTKIEVTLDPPPANVDRFGRQVVRLPDVYVAKESGEPVADAQAIAKKKLSRYLPTLRWSDGGADGVVKVSLAPSPESGDGLYDILVRAPGYTVQTTEVDLPTSATRIPVTLRAGTEVRLKITPFEGGEIPDDLVPALFPEKWGKEIWLATQDKGETANDKTRFVNVIVPQSDRDGEYTYRIDAQSTEPLYLLVHHPGFLRGFQAGPFDPAEWATSGTVTVDLPKPASLTGSFDLNGLEAENPVATLSVRRSQDVPGANSWLLTQLVAEMDATSASLTADDLAPGSYSLEVANRARTDIANRSAFSGRQSTTLKAGEHSSLSVKYKPFDESWIQGPYTAAIKVTSQGDTPVAGKTYSLKWSQTGYPQQTIAEGTVPDDGVIVVEDLAGLDRELTRDEIADYRAGALPSYTFELDKRRLGSVNFFESRDGKFYPLADGVTSKTFEFQLPPGIGDLAPDFEMIDLATSETRRLSDYRGQVVLIDFWATWCGPCQGPMALNQEIMRTNRDAWKDKAVILAVSIDEDADTVRKHLEKNGWHETVNTWAAPSPEQPDDTGWKTPAVRNYGITGIPTLIIVDPDGIIRQRGHMSDPAAEIEKYMR